MKSNLLISPTREMSADDWLAYRKRGIGASEVGTILGLNPYKCSAQLFYEKLDILPNYTVENMAMFLGKEQEDFIANLWQYWNPADPAEETMMKNYREKNVIRRCQRVNAYVHNPEFPWLFVSLDRKINKHSLNGVSGGIVTEGALELKTIAGYEANKWEAGVPPAYVIQVQTQLLVCGFPYGELAVFEDGRKFDVIPFEEKKELQETILTRTREFWDRVEAGRILMTKRFEAERNYNYAAVNDIEAQFSTIEPPPDGSEAFAKYLKERYKIAEPGEIMGSDEHMAVAVKHKEIADQIKQLEEQKRLQENILKNSLRDGADKITFGANGYVSWRADVNKIRRFTNKVKSA
jgi:putative phage-type endonuclease